VQQVQQVFRDLPAIQAHLERQDQLDQLETQDHKVRRVQMGLQDPLDLEAIQEIPVHQERTGSPEWLVNLEQLEHLAQLEDPVCLDLPGRLDSREHPELRDSRVLLDLRVIPVLPETQVLQVRLDQPVQLARLELMDNKDNLDHLVAKG